MDATYDEIGINYSDLRKPDPRIAERIWAALGTSKKVLNVGAGAGSYEPEDRDVTAIEPSAGMISQRRHPAAVSVQGYAENLPFEDNSFDATMAILTVHHWADKAVGMQEVRRVTRGPVVILTFDPSIRGFWLGDYFPELVALDDEQMPQMADYQAWLGSVEISTVPVPHDCQDGFLYAYWRRPHAYLDERLRAAISSFWKIGDLSEGLQRLEDDLTSGAWEERYGTLLEYDEWDFGYRLVVSG